jgi:hypothetical protein
MYVLGRFQGRHPTTGVASSPGYLHSCARGSALGLGTFRHGQSANVLARLSGRHVHEFVNKHLPA